MEPPIQQVIAIAVVQREGRVLIGQRPAGVPLAGLWEFPGGKLQPHETPAQAACRECLEETGLEVAIRSCLAVERHEYDYGRLELHFFDCVPSTPVPSPQPPFQFVPVTELGRYDFPAANAALIQQLLASAKPC
jgi:mutator protein MutT